jgi:hypothetical protein
MPSVDNAYRLDSEERQVRSAEKMRKLLLLFQRSAPFWAPMPIFSQKNALAFLMPCTLLQRTNTENLKQILPEKELGGHSPTFHIHMSVSDLYIPTIDLPILLQENMRADPEMAVADLILAKIYRFCQLLSHSRRFFARV